MSAKFLSDWRLPNAHLGLRFEREREDVRGRARGLPVRAQLLEVTRGHGRHQRHSHIRDGFGYFAGYDFAEVITCLRLSIIWPCCCYKKSQCVLFPTEEKSDLLVRDFDSFFAQFQNLEDIAKGSKKGFSNGTPSTAIIQSGSCETFCRRLRQILCHKYCTIM